MTLYFNSPFEERDFYLNSRGYNLFTKEYNLNVVTVEK